LNFVKKSIRISAIFRFFSLSYIEKFLKIPDSFYSLQSGGGS